MAASTAPVSTAPKKGFARFDIHQRMQHWMILGSFILCMLTGWPLKLAGVGASQDLVNLFGSLENCALIHRISAAIMLIGCVYHLIYLVKRWRRKTLKFGLIPNGKDFRDLVGNIRFFLGRRPNPPKFGRWTYFEKFDYWAVFWGIVIMGGSGLLLWFPEFFMGFMPGWTLNIAYIAHSDEALLAGLAIFIWHFYNVHLRKSVFPMSWVWLTGRVSENEMKRDHALEYERITGESLDDTNGGESTDDAPADDAPTDDAPKEDDK